jgi:hypothetical protein
MHIDYTASIDQTKVIPEQGGFENIVKKVIWEITFFDTENPESVQSVARVETFLDTDSINADTFVQWESLTQQSVLQKCLDSHGGTAFLDELLNNGHHQMLEQKLTELSLVEKSADLLAVE